MSDWPLFSIDEIASQHKNALATGPFGSSVGTSTFRTTGVPLIRGSNLSADVSTRLIEDEFVFVDEDLARKFDRSIASLGDIVFTCWGTINQVGIIDKGASFDRYLVSNKQMKLTVDTRKALPLYVYYFFSGPAGQAEIDMGAIGSSVPGFNLTKLRKIKIPLPSMYVQRKIVDILDGLDNKVQLNRQMNETLEATARAIFRDWFIDFGPTRAKMAGIKPYLAPEIWNLFPARLDDKGKPEGWKSGRLDDLLVLQRGFDLPIQDRTPGRYAVMAASGINGTHNEAMVRGPGVTTGRSGVLGQTFFVHEDFWPLNTSLWVKEFKASSPAHGYFLIRTLDFGSFNAGSAVPTLNRNHVHNLSQIIPDTALVSAFDEIALPLLKYQRANEKEAETLAATRDLLLPKLMSGEFRVTEATKMVEAELELHL